MVCEGQIILYGFTKIGILKSFYTKENCENKKPHAYSMPIIIALFFLFIAPLHDVIHHFFSYLLQCCMPLIFKGTKTITTTRSIVMHKNEKRKKHTHTHTHTLTPFFISIKLQTKFPYLNLTSNKCILPIHKL